MKPLSDTQEIARRFNEEEEVWRCFKEKRRLRDPNTLLPDSILDEIDWRDAEQECRKVRCVGIRVS